MLFEIQSGMTALEENKGGQKCLSVDNVSVCVVMVERQGNPRSWVPLLLMLEDLDRESLECFYVQNFSKMGGKLQKAYQMRDDL